MQLVTLAAESKSLARALENYGFSEGWISKTYCNDLNTNMSHHFDQDRGQKYDPNQRRAPAGSSNGGQWVSDGGGSGGHSGSSDSSISYGYREPDYHGDPDLPIEPVYPIEEAITVETGGTGILLGTGRRIAVGKLSDLSEEQTGNLGRFNKKLPVDAEQTTILKSGEDKIFRADVPARNIPGSYARYEKTVDATGNTTKYTKTTYAPGWKHCSHEDKIIRM